jgi:hypothetical protein
MLRKCQILLVCMLLTCMTQLVPAQTVTTGTLMGTVTDTQKAVIPNAVVVAVHVPTGTSYQVLTQADGRYLIPSARVGGPYTIKVSAPKLNTQEQREVQLALGESRQVNFTLQPAVAAETVTVTAEAQLIDTSVAGAVANVSSDAIQELPSISRSINDLARTSPYFNTSSDSAGGADMISVAGRNNRYNNMQIDGAVNNDVFGLASTGTPGGQTGTQPVSLDAIQEIQLLVSPYDVRQGGFSGGGINAVTKSGSNSLHGNAYFYGRNEDWVRSIPGVGSPAAPHPGDIAVGPFSDKQVGFSVGGPIVKDRAFFFTNFDWARKTTPSGYSLDGKSGVTWGNPTFVQQVIDIAKNTYGFDAGATNEFAKPNNSNKAFVRGDVNLTKGNQLMVRMNYVDGTAYIGTIYNNTYKMPSNFYSIRDKMTSFVGQLNSTMGKVYNEFRVTYQRERNNRGNQPGFKTFPEVRVDFTDGNYVYLGTEYSSQVNKLNQDIVEITDDLTIVKGNHTISVGTHNELYKFYNAFIQYYNGGYRFSSIANFQSGIAQSFNHNFSNSTTDPINAAQLPVYQFGFYGGDQWRVRSNFLITYGLRVDIPHFPDSPHANALVNQEFNYKTDLVPAPVMWSPRVGFNWNFSGDKGKRAQIRGGIGLFTGRTPYVWLSNQYSNTGVDFTSLAVSYSSSNKIPFVADPNNQPTTVTGGTTGRQTVNVIDPDYKFPTVLRMNAAMDHELGFLGLVGIGEFIYTKNLKDILYKNLNYIPTGTLPDGRSTFGKFDSNLNDVLLLTNTDKGHSWSLSFKVERPFKSFSVSGSYLYGRSFGINDGTSSVARSNWANNPAALTPNDPPVGFSRYDVGHRVNFSASVPVKLFKGLKSTATVFFNGQSGFRYSLGFNGDANADGVTNNDLLFIPSSASQVVVYSSTSGQAASWDQLNAYFNQTAAKDYRGQIFPRYAGRARWTNQLDLRYAIRIPFGEKARAEASIDVFNFLNLINKDWGWQYFGSFPSTNLIGYGGIDKASGKVMYNLSTINSTTYQGVFTRDDLRSRSQAQFGIRFVF